MLRFASYLGCFLNICFTQTMELNRGMASEWTWIAGDGKVDNIAVPSHPGGMSGASLWYDKYADITWMFGGRGFSEYPSGQPQLLNDLWQFGSIIFNSSDSFTGRPLINWRNMENKPSKFPPARKLSSMCGVQQRLVLFSGLGESDIPLDDIWLYNVKLDSWEKVLESQYRPKPRGHAATWCAGPFMYIFGGLGNDGTVLSDMWRLDLFSLNWTQLQGAREDFSYASQINLPEGRNGAATWIDKDAFYMFGGNSADGFSYSLPPNVNGLRSDLWCYFPFSYRWERVTRQSDKNHPEPDTEVLSDSSEDFPGSRIGAGTWVDMFGDLWLFGGAGLTIQSDSPSKLSQVLSDTWRFSVKNKIWTIVDGSQTAGARTEMMVMQSQDANKVVIFGGRGHGTRGLGGYLNDVWSVDVSATISGMYAISGASVMLFMGTCLGLLVVAMIVGLWGRKSFHLHGLYSDLTSRDAPLDTESKAPFITKNDQDHDF